MPQIKEKLPRHFQRVITTGMLRVVIKVPPVCQDRLPAPERGKSYLIEHLHTSDLRTAERRERELGVIHTFTKMIEQARPVPTRWAYVVPTAWEIERMRILVEGFIANDPATYTPQGRRLYESIKSGESVPVLETEFQQAPITEPTTKRNSLTFDAGTDLWANEKKVPPETRDLYRASMGMLRRHVGHDSVNLVKRADLIGWKDALVQSPLASKSIKNRLGHAKTVLQHLFENDKLDENPNPPEKPVRYKHIKNPRTARLNFDPDDRAAIYRHALAETRPLYRYGNLLPLFSGMRVEEFAEADTRDIVQVDGVWCMLLNYDYRAENQNLKNDESIRKIPLHSAILKAGFLNYVKGLPPGPLFPMLKKSKHGRLRQDASRKLGEWLRETVGIVDPRKVMHSHRHSAETLMEAAGVPKARAYKITGHAAQDVGEDYIHRQVETLRDAVEEIPVPNVAPTLHPPKPPHT